ncbi:dermonecrotic toxin domain-containing protein [Pseudomonas sp. COR18]|uniref:dermonecrotic toxin domain-containing protein n=1 Tax=Pseudomonas sp. COR18 TaxID=3399680 RepID=UPI003B005A12
MPDQPPFYLLSQAAELRSTLSAEEQALSIDSAERNWLSNLYLANQDAREALDEPMYVDKLLIVAQGATTADLAGSFLASGAAGHAVFLCTPAFGLERFGSRDLALAKVRERLAVPAQRDELLRFVPLHIRNAIGLEPLPALITRPIQGIVLDDRRQAINTYLDITLKDLQDELLELPSLKSLLNRLFDSTLGKRFPQANLKALRVISHPAPSAAESTSGQPLRALSTHSLTETLLERYNHGPWPGDQVHEFLAPGYTAQAADTAVWENTLLTLASQLPGHLQSRLNAFWDAPLAIGQPRRHLFVDALGSRFRAELLHQEQDLNEIAADDYPVLSALYPLDRSRLGAVALYTLMVQSSAGSYPLANAFVVHNLGRRSAEYLLYGADRLQAFDSQAALLESVRTQLQQPGQDPDWHLGLSLRERAELQSASLSGVALVASSLSIFDTLFSRVISKLLDNVSYVLKRYRDSDGALVLPAAFDSALDIRGLISPRLPALAKGPRWSHRLDLSPSEKPASQPLIKTLRPTLETARHQLATLEQLKSRLSEGLQKRPSLKDFIRGELSSALKQAKLHNLSPDNLYLNHYASALPEVGDPSLPPLTSRSVVDHVLERLTDGSGEPDQTTSGLFSKTADGGWSRVTNLEIEPFNRIVATLLPDLLGQYLRRQRSLYGELSGTLHEAIRSGLRQEVQLKEMRGALNAGDLDLLDNLLDSHRRDERPGLHGFIPDAFALTYRPDTAAAPIRLHNCFLLTAHGGLDQEHSGRTLLWTPAQGAEAFDSLHSADNELQRRLHDPVERLSLLENTTQEQRPRHLPIATPQRGNRRTYPSLGFELIHNGLQNNRYNSLIDKALADLNHAVTSDYKGDNLHQHLQSCLDSHATVPMLERALQAAQNSATHLALPPWLRSASDSQQFALAALLDRYRQDAATTDDYHRGIPDIRETARTKLKSLLARDFPQAYLDPQRITVWLTPREAALPLSEPLSEFVLRHVDDIRPRAISLSSDAGSLPGTLTDERIKALVQEADIGQHYAALLESHLSPEVLHNAHRRPAFSRHSFWQGLLHAFVQRLRNTLSEKAHAYIKHLLAMPDGVARLPLDGQHIELKPLQLQSGAQTPADPVAGFYLIGPHASQPGPRVLFCPQGDRPVFQEYPSEAALLGDLGRSTSLQQQVLERLPLARYAHYAQQAFKGALTLGDHPERGNLFHRLYQDMTGLFKHLLGCQYLAGRGSLWNKALSWLKGELQQGATHLLGRLRLPWLVWQSLSQLRDAGQKAWQGRWSEAIEAFAMTLAKLAMARRGWVQSDLGGAAQPPASAPAESPFPSQAWGDQRLTPGQKAMLLGLQAQRVALQHMTPNRAGDLYTDPASRQTFVAIGGRVFRVRQEQQRWRIVTDSGQGPWLRQDSRGQWSFDLADRCLKEAHHENA